MCADGRWYSCIVNGDASYFSVCMCDKNQKKKVCKKAKKQKNNKCSIVSHKQKKRGIGSKAVRKNK